jgi:hypothetical protein
MNYFFLEKNQKIIINLIQKKKKYFHPTNLLFCILRKLNFIY